ncbi:hypothetical protein TCON_1128 [Astathelohania contejeani]|uniref:Uncharacterized protein n=1 Tax=Astathelohania contejeani TaxID=164912 RepID=A0ABQ7HZT3_9MICR|nr:hypothetical protein TCON_1128 [Thelohania contejeani]
MKKSKDEDKRKFNEMCHDSILLHLSNANEFIYLILPEYLSFKIFINTENFLVIKYSNMSFILLLKLIMKVYDCQKKIKLKRNEDCSSKRYYFYHIDPIFIKRKKLLKRIIIRMFDLIENVHLRKELYIELELIENYLERKNAKSNKNLIIKNLKICNLISNIIFQIKSKEIIQIRNNLKTVLVEIPNFEHSYSEFTFYISIYREYMHDVETWEIIEAYDLLIKNYSVFKPANKHTWYIYSRLKLITECQSKICMLNNSFEYRNVISLKANEQLVVDLYFLHYGYLITTIDTRMLIGSDVRRKITNKIDKARKTYLYKKQPI